MRALPPLLAFAATLLLAGSASADVLSDLEAPFREALASGSWGMVLGIAFAAGLATSLTPCVYPMIVITVSVFGARQAKSKLESAWLSTVFVLGIAALFTPMGVIAAMTGGVFGSYLSNPFVLVGLALFFLAMAASMFGAFDLDLPASIKNRLATVDGVGARGAFLIGLVSGLIAAPCTGPVVGALLTWVGTTQNMGFGAAIFFVYSLGLGLLFWMVGTFSMSLPKSGMWLDGVKSVFGIVMVVAAIYFVKDLLGDLSHWPTRTSAFLWTSVALIVGGIVAGAIHLTYHGGSLFTKGRKTVGIAATIAGLCGVVGYLEALPEGAKIQWMEDIDSARELARAGNKPMLIDFGASWCQACGELDRHTFTDAAVVREGLRFVPIKVDLSPGKDTEEKKALLASYDHRGLPLVVLHDSEGQEAARVTNFVEPAAFLEMMRKVK